MAHILRNIRRTTIKSRTYLYLILVISAAVFINLMSIMFYNVNLKQYEKGMLQILNLNQFYVSLEKENAFWGNYINTGKKETIESYRQEAEKARNYLAQIDASHVSQIFLRDIQDLKNMFQIYQEKLNKVEDIFEAKKNFTSENLSDIYEEYNVTQSLYEAMDSEFKNLHLTLIGYTNQRMELLREKRRLYEIEFLGILFILIFYSIKKGKNLADHISIPIQSLTRTAEKIRDGNMDAYTELSVENPGIDEIHVLFCAFEVMLHKIREQMKMKEEAAEAKIQLREKELENAKILNQLTLSQLKVLQMQMNPHFLFNTLNMIAKTVYLGDAEETVFLLNKTTQLLRYSLDYMGKSVTLSREFEILDCYVCLQEKRFGKRIDFDFDLDERFHQVQVPCLILQPLVENAITHGVGMYTEGGKILIRTRWEKEKQKGIICVIDNGIGIKEEDLERVKQKLTPDWRGDDGIGLGNVYMRLDNFFKRKADMQIFSIPYKETIVKIIIPTDGKEV